MHRLLQGEVGSGKTFVALRAMLQVVDAGYQAVLLAPTEVLAQQHYATITGMLRELAAGGGLDAPENSTGVALLTGSMKTAGTRTALADIASGAAGIVIGTHALLSGKVIYNNIGLVVVDEQHRFGVEQRSVLTVAMTVFGDLEVSTLRELPSGRADIQTTVVDLPAHRSWLARAWERIREECEAGHQVFVVCPRISSDDADDVESGRPPTAAVEEIAPQLASGPLTGLRIDVLHSRLDADEKKAVMDRFADGESQVLISTTVIEVGVDVPNATMMVIMDADRFGVSQLHQLRGRIGRGKLPGLCLLVTTALPGTTARERLAAALSWPNWTWPSVTRAMCSDPPSRGIPRRCGCCGCSTTPRSSLRPRISPNGGCKRNLRIPGCSTSSPRRKCWLRAISWNRDELPRRDEGPER